MSEVAYRTWLILNSRSQRTIFNHLKSLKVLLRELPSWNKPSVDSFILGLKERGCRNSTINSYINCIRTYSVCMGFDESLVRYKFLKPEPVNKGTLSDGEIEAFLNMGKPKGVSGKYWTQTTLFFSLLAYTGCRPCEIARLKTPQIYDNLLILTDTKTKRPRNVPIPELIRPMLEKHLRELKGENLFITQRGKIYSDHFWIPAFEKRIEKLGIKRPNVTCYSFRHSMATSLLRASPAVNIHVIAKLLGNSPKQIYESYDHLVVGDVENALNRHPLIRKNLRPTSDEILAELEQVLKNYNLRFDISKNDKELKLSVFLG